MDLSRASFWSYWSPANDSSRKTGKKLEEDWGGSVHIYSRCGLLICGVHAYRSFPVLLNLTKWSHKGSRSPNNTNKITIVPLPKIKSTFANITPISILGIEEVTRDSPNEQLRCTEYLAQRKATINDVQDQSSDKVYIRIMTRLMTSYEQWRAFSFTLISFLLLSITLTGPGKKACLEMGRSSSNSSLCQKQEQQ